MARSVLILGSSGSGKSHSIQNLDDKSTFLINVFDKALPFRGWKKRFTKVRSFKEAIGNMIAVDDSEKVVASLQYGYSRGFRTFVVDDYQFVAGMKTIRDAKVKGFDKFTEVAQGFVSVADVCKLMPDDAIVFFLSHTEDDGRGGIKAKTAGKMVDNVIGFESLFTIVLLAFKRDGMYGFETQANGQSTSKSPEGMFPNEIPNDLELVRTTIIAYDEGEELPLISEVKKISVSSAKEETVTVKAQDERNAVFNDVFTPERPVESLSIPEDSFENVDPSPEDLPFTQDEPFDFSPEASAVESKTVNADSFNEFLVSISREKPALVSLMKIADISFVANTVKATYLPNMVGQYNSVSNAKGIAEIQRQLGLFYGFDVLFTPFIKEEEKKSEPEPFVKTDLKVDREQKVFIPETYDPNVGVKTELGFEDKLNILIEKLGGKAEATAFLVSKKTLKDGSPIESMSITTLERLFTNIDKLVAVKNGANNG